MPTLSLSATRVYGSIFRVRANGTAALGSTISVNINEETASLADVDANGNWQMDLYLDAGQYDVSAVARGPSGEDLGASPPLTLTLEYTTSQSLPSLHALQNVVVITAPTNSSFCFVNHAAGLGAFAREDATNEFTVFAYGTTAEVATFKYFGMPFVSSTGKVLFSTSSSQSAADIDTRPDTYMFDAATGMTTLVAVSAPPFHRYGTAPATSVYDVQAIGIDFLGQPVVLLNHTAPSVIRKGYTNQWGTEFVLANPNQTSVSMRDDVSGEYYQFNNYGIRTPSLDPSGRFLAVTEEMGPADHVGVVIDLQSNTGVSVVNRSADTFTFHLGVSNDNTVRSFLEVPSWYDAENQVIEKLRGTQLIHQVIGGATQTIDTGLIPFQQLSADGRFVYYHKLDVDGGGLFIYDTTTNTRTPLAPLNTQAFTGEPAIVAAFLDNGFPRSIAARSFFAGAGADDFQSLKQNFIAIFPQAERNNMPALGFPFPGISISRVLDFWDTPQDVPVVIMHRNDLPAMEGDRHELYVFDFATGYRRIGTASSATSNADGTSVLTQGADNVFTGAGNDIVYAGGGSDTVESGSGDDLVFAGKGDDVVIGGSGLGNDSYSGGEGVDTLRYVSAVRPITIDARLGEASGTDIGSDTFVDFEAFIAGQGPDIVYASPLGSRIDGYTGNDALIGNIGADVLLGGLGNDVLVGQGGIDRLDGQKGDDAYVFSVGSHRATAEISDSEGGLDEVRLASGTNGDTITLFAGDRGIEIVSLVSGNGYTRDLSGTVSLNLDAASAPNGLTVFGNGGSNILRGTRFSDRIFAGYGNDRLEGVEGKDLLSGGFGDDTYALSDSQAIIDEKAGQGQDTIETALAVFSLAPYKFVERLVSTAPRGAKLSGGVLNDQVVGSPNADRLDGGKGVDRLEGRGGDDTYLIDNSSDACVEDAEGGIDTVISNVSYTLPAHVENITLTGKASINATGNDIRNALFGNIGRNVLRGEGGNDSLYGGAADDQLFGGEGDDTLSGSLGNDILEGGSGADVYLFDSPLNARSNVDRIGAIMPFQSGLDRIQLNGAVFRALAQQAGALRPEQFVVGAKATYGANRIVYNRTTGAVSYDADGSGPTAAAQFLTLVGSPDLAATDLWVS